MWPIAFGRARRQHTLPADYATDIDIVENLADKSRQREAGMTDHYPDRSRRTADCHPQMHDESLVTRTSSEFFEYSENSLAHAVKGDLTTDATPNEKIFLQT